MNTGDREEIARPIAEALASWYMVNVATMTPLAVVLAAALLDPQDGREVLCETWAEACKCFASGLDTGSDDADARWLAELAPLLALHRMEVFSTTPECGHCRDFDGDPVKWPCPTIAALPERLREERPGG